LYCWVDNPLTIKISVPWQGLAAWGGHRGWAFKLCHIGNGTSKETYTCVHPCYLTAAVMMWAPTMESSLSTNTIPLTLPVIKTLLSLGRAVQHKRAWVQVASLKVVFCHPGQTPTPTPTTALLQLLSQPLLQLPSDGTDNGIKPNAQHHHNPLAITPLW
jgi:hypothetical protein